MPQRDFVLRWIEEIVRTVHRMLLGPGPVDLDRAGVRVDEAIEQLLGPLALLVPRLDAPSASDLLGDSDRILGYADLLDLRAAIEDARGTPDLALASRARAALLRDESRGQDPRDSV